jgi:hypothetical protein
MFSRAARLVAVIQEDAKWRPSSSTCAVVEVCEPGRVFDRVVRLDEVPDGYRAMNERER